MSGKSVPLRYVVISFAALVVAAVAVIVIVLNARPTPLPVSIETPAAAPTFTMRGHIEIQDRSLNNIRLLPGNSCIGTGGYSDLTAGSEVTVKNPTGQVVATGALDTGGTVTTESHSTACVMSFEVRNVPDGLSSYSLTVTHRGTQVFPNGQAHGFVQLTIG